MWFKKESDVTLVKWRLGDFENKEKGRLYGLYRVFPDVSYVVQKRELSDHETGRKSEESYIIL